MDMDMSATFLAGSILVMMGFVVIIMGIVLINNIFHKLETCEDFLANRIAI
jgi:uncharacterized membrane protein